MIDVYTRFDAALLPLIAAYAYAALIRRYAMPLMPLMAMLLLRCLKMLLPQRVLRSEEQARRGAKHVRGMCRYAA